MECRIFLEPHELTKNFNEILLKKVKLEVEKKCFLSIGFVLEVCKIERIIFEEIMNMIPNVYFLLEVQVIAYLPKVGDIIEIHVSFIFNHGIFGFFEDIKVLIPIQSCKGYKLKQEQNQVYLFHDLHKKKIEKNSILVVELKNIRFEKENFACIAELYKENSL
jgi:DNA-directed RNA polymerase subunit E'/Rpb7